MAQPIPTSRILRRLLASGAHGRAANLLGRIHPADVGPLLSDLGPDEIRTVVELLFRQQRAENLLRELPFELLGDVMEALGDARLAEVLGRLEVDDVAELVDALPETRREAILELALPGDVAIVKAHRADRMGNLTYRGTAANFNPVMAAAARLTLVETEIIVEPGEIAPENVHTPSVYVDRVVLGEDLELRSEA